MLKVILVDELHILSDFYRAEGGEHAFGTRLNVSEKKVVYSIVEVNPRPFVREILEFILFLISHFYNGC
jgi:hypothetical protein